VVLDGGLRVDLLDLLLDLLRLSIFPVGVLGALNADQVKRLDLDSLQIDLSTLHQSFLLVLKLVPQPLQLGGVALEEVGLGKLHRVQGCFLERGHGELVDHLGLDCVLELVGLVDLLPLPLDDPEGVILVEAVGGHCGGVQPEDPLVHPEVLVEEGGPPDIDQVRRVLGEELVVEVCSLHEVQHVIGLVLDWLEHIKEVVKAYALRYDEEVVHVDRPLTD